MHFGTFNSSTNGDNNATDFLSNRRMAPLYDDLSTVGAANDIFVSTATPGRVIIRWAALNKAEQHFKTAQKDSHAIVKLFQQMKKMGATRIGLLSSNTGFGKAGKEQIAKLAPEHGIQIVVDEVYDKAATDLTAEVTKLKAANVQAILNWSIEPAQAIVIKNARQVGFTAPIFQSHGFANIQYVKAAGAAAEGVIFPASRVVVAEALPEKHPQKLVVVAYKKAYEARYGEDVSAFGGYAHDALGILVKAIQQAGVDKEKVRAAVEGMKGYVGTAGVFSFSPADHNGLELDAFEMVTVKDGKFVLLAK
jgi:branched-chain amino acid transport system substrate-binding protein